MEQWNLWFSASKGNARVVSFLIFLHTFSTKWFQDVVAFSSFRFEFECVLGCVTKEPCRAEVAWLRSLGMVTKKIKKQ